VGSERQRNPKSPRNACEEFAMMKMMMLREVVVFNRRRVTFDPTSARSGV